MSKKTYALLSAIIGGCGTIASAIVTYVQPAYATATVAAVGVASTAVIEIFNLFTDSSSSSSDS